MNHWTIRTRILASFSFILLVMLLMSVVAYNRLTAIDHEAVQMQRDALPGLNYSTGLRGVWGELYVLGWETVSAASDSQRLQFQQTRDALQRLDSFAAAVRIDHVPRRRPRPLRRLYGGTGAL